jgi:AraC-like DNA-binding protein
VGYTKAIQSTVNVRAFEYYRPLVRLRRFVESNYDEDISLLRAARVAALERTYFCTFFRKKVGIGFRDWLRRVRVEKAMLMFAQQDSSISEVAFAVGFADLSTFERAFKEFAKMTPMQFKKTVAPGD